MDKEKILIVDDEPTIRVIFKSLLEQDGYETMAVTSGEDAIKIVSGMGNLISLAIVDLRMIGIDGIETIKQLRLIAPELMIIMTTAMIPPPIDAVALISDLKNMGVVLLLEKPFSFSTFPINVALLLNARKLERLKVAELSV